MRLLNQTERILLLTAQQAASAPYAYQFPLLSPQVSGGQCGAIRWMIQLCLHSLCITGGNLCLRTPNLKGGCQQTCPTSAQEGDIIFNILNTKEIFPLPQREIPSPRLSAIQTSLKRQSRIKAVNASVQKMYKKCERNMNCPLKREIQSGFGEEIVKMGG